MRTKLSLVGASLVRKLAQALTCALLLAPAAWAQQRSGIAGVVRDTSGAVLPGVTVEAASPALIEKVRTGVTDGQGLYNIVDLRPGTYTVTFTLTGFSTVRREGIELTTGFTATANTELRVGAVTETITVTGASPVVDIRNVSQQSVMTREIIDALPTGKAFSNFGGLIPGISTWTNLGGQDSGGALGNDGQMMMIHGSRTADQLLRIDGMPMGMLDGSGAPPLGTPSDGVTQETVLSTGSHAAEVETGGVYANIIPRSGSNTFSGGLFASFANDNLQWANVTAAEKAQGVAAGGIRKNTDVNPTFGGPIQRDRLWFFGSVRDRRSVRDFSLFPDTNHADWVYTPDTRNPAPDEHTNWDVSGRATWQASARHKFNVAATAANDCWCQHILGSSVGITSMNTNYSHWPNKYTQVSWTAPVTNKLLLEAAGQLGFAGWKGEPQPGAVAPAAFEQSTGIWFRARGGYLAYQDTDYGNHFARFSLSYVTGAHAFKVGTTVFPATHQSHFYSLADYDVTLLNGQPVAATYLPFPYTSQTYALKWGAFAQDQWTLKRLTVNAGLRFDSIDAHYPDYRFAATNILPARNFPGADMLRWRDLSPRLGVNYDLFGNGKTAIKASVNRYVAGETTGIRFTADPAFVTGTLTRSWNDGNRDFVPQGDPLDPAANGELGPSPNRLYGQPSFYYRSDPDYVLGGFGSRMYNWEFSTSIQHEVAPRVSVNLGYFRRIYGNFTVVNNLAVAATDYDPYCITAPRDSRLPRGGGEQICGLYDLNPSKVGQYDGYLTLAKNYGDQYQHYNSVDLTLSARLSQGVLLQGGLSTTKGVSDTCDIVAKVGGNPSTRFCHAESAYLTQVKFLGSYTLPWAFQIAATYSSVPGVGIPATATPDLGLQATYVATDAVIAPSLGRNLSSSSFATMPLLEPGTTYQDRLQQLDLRLARTFAAGRTRIKPMLDLFNLFNANTAVLVTDIYGVTGAGWLQPQQVLQGRYAKLGVQVDF
jgi:hypothetical protein